jgi:valyl-tRNA synthetase
MAPFITEELFSHLQKKFHTSAKETIDIYTKECLTALSSKACIEAPYPTILVPEDRNLAIEQTFSFLDEIIHAIRNIRAEMQLPPSIATDVYIVAEEKDPVVKILQENKTIVRSLVKIQSIQFTLQDPLLGFSAQKRVSSLQIIIPLPQELKEKEHNRLIKEKERLSLQLTSLSAKLSQEEFLAKAPKEVLNKLQNQEKEIKKQLEEIELKLKS